MPMGIRIINYRNYYCIIRIIMGIIILFELVEYQNYDQNTINDMFMYCEGELE